MDIKLSKKYWSHILIWLAMIVYFFFAPDLFTFVFAKNGKPLKTNQIIPLESDKITFVVDGLEPYIKDGEDLYTLYGWSFIARENSNDTEEEFVREIVLVSDERKYFFSVNPEYRNPGLPSEYVNMGIKLGTLGFRALIAEDFIEPGKYRIGIIFKDASTGTAFYADKPSWYLVRTPNTIELQEK